MKKEKTINKETKIGWEKETEMAKEAGRGKEKRTMKMFEE